MAFVKVGKTVITYNAGISAFEKGQQWQLALGLLAEMSFVKVGKDVDAYNCVVSACEMACGLWWSWPLREFQECDQA